MSIIIMLVLGFLWYQLIAIFGLSIGLHRRFAHNQFQTSKTFEVISLFLSMLAFSRSPVGWIGAHRIHHKFSDTEKDFQLIRRGRYVEFNLIYDRGTLFGLQSNGRIESILASLPNNTKWQYKKTKEYIRLEKELLSTINKDWNV